MLNVAVLMGRLVRDPELKHTPNDVSVTSFTIAVDRSYQKQGEDRQADFIDIVAWRSTADFVCKYFKKGQMIAVNGEIQTRTYTDKDGNKRKAFEIVADKVSFCGSKSDNQGGSGGSYQPATNTPDIPADAPQYAKGDTGDFEQVPIDDDLPF